MHSSKKILVFFSVFVALSWGESSSKEKPSIDLEDYIDIGISKRKSEDLGTSESGYYNYAPPVHHGHEISQHGYSHSNHHHAHPEVHHHVAPEVHYPQHHGDHHSHSQGYAHIPYDSHGHDHAHAHSYYDQDGTGHYGHVLGHVSSAHVSYGTNINHGYGHYHHHPHGTYH